MSEQPVAARGGKTYGGLSRNQWFIVGGVFVAALGYILWKRHQANAAGAAASGTVNAGSNECTDSNGNPVDCNQAFAQELAGLQNALSGAQSGGFGGGSAGTSSGWTDTTGALPGDTGTAAATTTAVAPGTPTTSTGSGTTAAGPISNLQASSVTRTAATVRWNPAAGATQGYAYKVTQLNGVTVKAGNTRSTSVTLGGLHPGWTYNFGVQGLPGGPGDNIHFTCKG